MKIPLSELLKQITPLPWNQDKVEKDYSQMKANRTYSDHAANVMLKLLEEAKSANLNANTAIGDVSNECKKVLRRKYPTQSRVTINHRCIKNDS